MKSKNLGVEHPFRISIDQEKGEIGFETPVGRRFARIEIETAMEDVSDPDAPGMLIQRPGKGFCLHFVVLDTKNGINSNYAGVMVGG